MNLKVLKIMLLTMTRFYDWIPRMLKLKTEWLEKTPPGGFRDVCPETGFPFVADNLFQLIEKETKHLEANKKPIPTDLRAQIENRLCHQMPPTICEPLDGERFHGGRSRKPLNSIINTTRVFNDREHRCSEAQAATRAVMCFGCEHNVHRSGCSSCRGITAALREMLDGRSTPWDSKIHVCDVLGVYTRVLVHVANPAFDENSIGSTPKDCWVRNTRNGRSEHGGEAANG